MVARCQIRTRDGRVADVTLASGEEIDAAIVITTAHPQISFLRLLDPAVLPPDFIAGIRGWQTRSGTVKINLALDRLPVFASHPQIDPQVHGGTIVLAESLDDVETAFRDAVSGHPWAKPFADICIPSVFDDSLAPPGQHVMSMFTQWVPHTYAGQQDDDRRAVPGRVVDARRRRGDRDPGPQRRAPDPRRPAGCRWRERAVQAGARARVTAGQARQAVTGRRPA
ncbi:MAG: phytoene desaturase family protein [Streptosporangiaceae bacterium]